MDKCPCCGDDSIRYNKWGKDKSSITHAYCEDRTGNEKCGYHANIVSHERLCRMKSDLTNAQGLCKSLSSECERLKNVNQALLSALYAAIDQAWGDSHDVVTVEDGDKITVVLSKHK